VPFRSRHRLSLAAAALVAAALAGAARAEPPARPDLSRLDLSRLASRFEAGQALKAEGIARTSLDRAFQGRPGAASVGFLCGLQPSDRTSGAAGALGRDHDGRFLGAQLRLGFR
jgi:hypothetical protein